MADRHCIAVVSPFMDKRHGTERCIAEQVERLAHQHGYDIHLYSQRVQDIEGLEEFGKCDGAAVLAEQRKSGSTSTSPERGRVFWHKVWELPAPHLVKYFWWLLSNQLRRWSDRYSGRLNCDLVYSAGINCWDADAIVVHIVFHEFYRTVARSELQLRKLPLRFWPRAIQRKLFYRLAMGLEKTIYSDHRAALAAVSSMTAEEIRRHFGREDVQVILSGIDLYLFNPGAREKRRADVRRSLGLCANAFVLLIIGNDWRNKGLTCLLEAVARLPELPLEVLVVGRDARAPYEAVVRRLGLEKRVRFLVPSADVMQFYAAADAYVGPSLYDAFALPVAEAMACQLPTIVSKQAGVSELLRDGIDALVLRDPRDDGELAEKIRLLCENPELRHRLAENAAQSARQLSWERNAEKTHSFLEWALKRKQQRTESA